MRQILTRDAESRTDAERKSLRDFFRQHHWPEYRRLSERLTELTQQKTKLEGSIATTLISKERAEPTPAYLLKRGQYDQPDLTRGPLTRHVPKFLPPLPEDAPRNRLGLAQWLVADDNPLTARVTVNRLWQQFFGTGIVKTSEDFGSQGSWPTHPDLLDWLAVEFRESGWDVKHMIKLIVMSATYQQSSVVSAERLAQDSRNEYLTRGPRFRLDAEVLRDQALAISGLLVPAVGGPSVKPPQPSGLWEAVGYVGSNTQKFMADSGADNVYRRSMYTFWKRTSPPPQMTICDAPTREACVARRERTNTPLQALLLLNEEEYLQAARQLAENTMAGQSDVELWPRPCF